MIVSTLASVKPKLPFVETGLVREILLFATYPESKLKNSVFKIDVYFNKSLIKSEKQQPCDKEP